MLFNLKHHCTKRLCHVVNNQKVRTGILNMLELQATFKKACTLNFLPLCDTADLVSTNSCVCLNSFTIGISFIRFFPPLPPPPKPCPLWSHYIPLFSLYLYIPPLLFWSGYGKSQLPGSSLAGFQVAPG